MRSPNGFEELVDMVEAYREKPQFVKNDEEVWDRFCWSLLLGGNRNESQVNFVYGKLYDYGLFYRKNLNPDWLSEARECLSIEKEMINEPNAKGKIAAINKIKAEIENIETALKSADEIFERMGINASYLKSIKDDKIEEDKLLCQIASQDETKCIKFGQLKPEHRNKIYWVAYTKAILWLHECGLGLNYIPNNNHSINFLDECDTKFNTPNKADFWVIQGRIREFCNYIQRDIYFLGLSLWYYGATKSLIKSKKNKQLYSPKKLLNIMKDNDLNIGCLSNMLGNIEKIEELEEILN